MKKYDIGYICTDFPPNNNAGAVRNSFFVDELEKNLKNVLVFAPEKNDKYKIVKNTTALPLNTDSNILRLIKEIIYGVELFFRILFQSKCSLYIVSPPPFFLNLFAVLAIKMKGASYLLDIRDLYPEVYFSKKIIKRDSYIGKMLIFFESWLYKGSSRIITVTDGLKIKIDENEQLKPVVTVRNGYDTNLFHQNNNKYSNFTIVFHGNLGQFQDIDLLVSIAKKIGDIDSDISFLIIGSGSNSKKIKELKLPNIQYEESIPYHEIAKRISKCHIGVSFRTNDFISKTAFPVKVYEYIGVGIPIIVTPHSEAGAFVEKYNFGFQFEHNNQKKIVDKIIDIKNNYYEFEKKNQYGILFSRQSQYSIFSNLIGEIIEEK